jgi:hypothetical protein
MRLRHVPAHRGAAWVRQGFVVFARRPLAFAALFTAFLFCGLLAALLPFVGPLLLLTALPLVSLGFMLATQRTLQGRFATIAVFAAPLRHDRRAALALLKLGLLYAAATMAVMSLSDLADGGTFQALQDAMAGSRAAGEASREEIAALLADPRLAGGMLLRFTLAALLSLPFWHAPALAYWAGQGVGQALFSSTLACWRNRAAFLVYGLAWSGVVLGFGVVANVLAALLAHPQLIALVAVPAGLLFSTVFYVSLYFTFADCFAAGDAAASAATALDAGGVEKS